MCGQKKFAHIKIRRIKAVKNKKNIPKIVTATKSKELKRYEKNILPDYKERKTNNQK